MTASRVKRGGSEKEKFLKTLRRDTEKERNKSEKERPKMVKVMKGLIIGCSMPIAPI